MNRAHIRKQVAADARLLSLKTTTFGCEEGSLTGESVAVFKSTDPVAADSTIAVSRARVLVFSFRLRRFNYCVVWIAWPLLASPGAG